MDVEEVFLAVSRSSRRRGRTAWSRRSAPGDCLILPARTPFTLTAGAEEPFQAVACMTAGGQATMLPGGETFLPPWARMTEPDFAILLTTANRCVADRLLQAVTAVPGGEAMRSSFGFVLRAVAAERPTVSRLAELLGVTKQAASRMADDMVSAGFLRRGDDPGDRRRTPCN